MPSKHQLTRKKCSRKISREKYGEGIRERFLIVNGLSTGKRKADTEDRRRRIIGGLKSGVCINIISMIGREKEMGRLEIKARTAHCDFF